MRKKINEETFELNDSQENCQLNLLELKTQKPKNLILQSAFLFIQNSNETPNLVHK